MSLENKSSEELNGIFDLLYLKDSAKIIATTKNCKYTIYNMKHPGFKNNTKIEVININNIGLKFNPDKDENDTDNIYEYNYSISLDDEEIAIIQLIELEINTLSYWKGIIEIKHENWDIFKNICETKELYAINNIIENDEKVYIKINQILYNTDIDTFLKTLFPSFAEYYF